jgi:hypothetical protein
LWQLLLLHILLISSFVSLMPLYVRSERIAGCCAQPSSLPNPLRKPWFFAPTACSAVFSTVCCVLQLQRAVVPLNSCMRIADIAAPLPCPIVEADPVAQQLRARADTLRRQQQALRVQQAQHRATLARRRAAAAAIAAQRAAFASRSH